RVVERLHRHELALVELLGALIRLAGLRELGLRLLHVGGLLGGRKMRRVGGSVFRQRAIERRLLLIEVVLRLFAIEFDEHLSGGDAVAKVGENPSNGAASLRRDRHVVLGRERADHFDGTVNAFLPDGLTLDGTRAVGATAARAAASAPGLSSGIARLR